MLRTLGKLCQEKCDTKGRGNLSTLGRFSKENATIVGSKDVFERRLSTRSKAFSLSVCFDATKFVLLSFITLIEMICPIYGQNRCPRVKTGHFRLTCVAQKRLGLNSLTTTARADLKGDLTNGRSGNRGPEVAFSPFRALLRSHLTLHCPY